MKKIGLVVIAVILVFFASNARAGNIAKFKGTFLQAGLDVYDDERCWATSINVNVAETWEGGDGKPEIEAGINIFLSQHNFCVPALSRNIEGFSTLVGGLKTNGFNSAQINQSVEAYDYIANRPVVLDVHLRWETNGETINGHYFYRNGDFKSHYNGFQNEANLSGYVAIPEEDEVYPVSDMSWGSIGEAKTGEVIKE